ncbi:peptidoglycan DD-metalloendopeptidase family protein [Lysinibacillus sp. NPDC097214]|uniref:peptidoglycan DD-metalloendopeptidase family protein n=1 Tax=Lysinibacillus sp. NPDC097214 TaxID=3390584 RepID=UPI003CFDF1F8
MVNHTQNQQQSSPAADVAKRLGKKQLKKLLKKGAKIAVQFLKKLILALIKTVVGWVLALGSPVLLVIAGIGVALLIVYMIISMAFSLFPEILSDDELAERERYISIANEYDIPFELLIAGVQIQGSLSDYNDAQLQEIASKLQPHSTYKNITLHSESYSVRCVNGNCTDSSVSKSSKEVPVVDYTEKWDRIVHYDYEIEYGAWNRTNSYSETKCTQNKDGTEICNETSGYTMSRDESYTQIPTETLDYTKFETAFQSPPFNYSTDDLYAVEVFYALTDNWIEYKEWKNGTISVPGSGSGSYDGTVIPGSSIPSEFFKVYMAAQAKYGVDWYYLAAIHFVETRFSTIDPMVSYVGAEGHTQFMPCTWHGWGYPGCKGTIGYVNIPEKDKYKPETVKKYNGYGVDGNNNGIVSPWEIEDAIFATANNLAKNGYSKNIDNAIFAYNHSQTYIKQVKAYAKQFKEEASYINDATPNSLGFVQATTGKISSRFENRTIGGNTAFHLGLDIANNSGTPIRAVASGTVRSTNNTCPQIGGYGSLCGGGWGNYIIITHNINGQVYETVYAHLSSLNVKKGQTVQQSAVIGGMGTSGSSTGNHLHLELHKGIRKSGTAAVQTALNPELYVPI